MGVEDRGYFTICYNKGMNRLKNLEIEVKRLYGDMNPDREVWADWLYVNHVLVVTKLAKELAERFEIDAELSQAAALLHDIADVQMSRFNDDHETESLQIGKGLLREVGFTESEIKIVIDDACKLHSCRSGDTPNTDVGKILATADALAHIADSSFYDFAYAQFKKEGRLETFKPWFDRKMSKDFNTKIFFDEARKEYRSQYEYLVNKFS